MPEDRCMHTGRLNKRKYEKRCYRLMSYVTELFCTECMLRDKKSNFTKSQQRDILARRRGKKF